MVAAAGAAQLPKFSQQYVQRLDGAANELHVVANDFYRSARDAGLSREQALAQKTGTAFLDNRQRDMARTFDRAACLVADLAAQSGGIALTNLRRLSRFRDPDIVARTLEQFRPALPLTPAGLGFAALGYLFGWGLFYSIMALLHAGKVSWPCRS